MLKKEIKRILKTRSTWWLVAIALILSLFFIYDVSRTGLLYSYSDENGDTQIVRGLKGYELNGQRYAPSEGEVTPEFLSFVTASYHEMLDKYGESLDGAPIDLLEQKVLPYEPVFRWMWWYLEDEETGEMLTISDISPEQAMDFYRVRLATLNRTLDRMYNSAPQVVNYAMARADNGRGNFNYTYGLGSTNSFDDIGMYAFIVCLICAVITAPVFSAEYQNGADDILRSTKNGRRQLALTKLLSAMIINLGIFTLCVGLMLGYVLFVFGFDDNTSGELLQIQYNPDALTAMGALGTVLLASVLALLAMTSFTLFLSSRFKNPVAVLSIAIAVGLVPTILEVSGVHGNVSDWIRCLLPSGGISLAGEMSQALRSLRFVWAGSFVTWTPYVILVAAAVQIPVWLVLAVVSYTRHQAA